MATAKSTQTKLNKAQRDAAKLIRDAEREARGLAPTTRPKNKTQRKQSLRRRVVKRIPRKYKTTRAAAHIVFGTGAILAVTTKYVVAKPAAAGARAAHRKIKDQQGKWTTGPGRAGGNPLRRRTVATCTACGDDFSSAQEINEHFLEVHANEKPAERKPRGAGHKVVRGATVKTAGMRIVHPDAKHAMPRGRHRPGNTKNSMPVTRVPVTYRQGIDQIGARGMTPSMQTALRGFNAMKNDLPPRDKPGGWNALMALLTALEEFSQKSPDALRDLEIELRRRNVDASVTRMPIARMVDALTDLGSGAVQLIVNMQDTYAPQVKAANGGVNTPDSKFFQKAS